MPKKHTVSITDGQGSLELVNGNYNVTANVTGYDVTSINPSNISIVEGTDDYKFTIEATGTLTLKITDTGDSANGGTPVVAAEFYRTDSEGNTYGDLIVSNEQGEVVFNKVPFSAEGAPTIYFKQVNSDGSHTFNTDVQSVTMTEETYTLNIANPKAALRTFAIEDSNYSGLAIATGTLTLESGE